MSNPSGAMEVIDFGGLRNVEERGYRFSGPGRTVVLQVVVHAAGPVLKKLDEDPSFLTAMAEAARKARDEKLTMPAWLFNSTENDVEEEP